MSGYRGGSPGATVTLASGAPAATTTGTSEQVLVTYSMPAGLINKSGAGLRINFFAHAASNGNNKLIRIRIGGLAGTIVADMNASTTNNGDIWTSSPTIVLRTGATTATAGGQYTVSSDASVAAVAATLSSSQRSVAITWANALDVVITGTTAGAAGDLTIDSYCIEMLTT